MGLLSRFSQSVSGAIRHRRAFLSRCRRKKCSGDASLLQERIFEMFEIRIVGLHKADDTGNQDERP